MSDGKHKLDYGATCALFCAMVLWSSSFIVMKEILKFFHPMTMIFFRMLFAALFFLFFIKYFSGRVHYQCGDWKLFAVMAICEPCLYFVFEAHALQYTTASQAGMITAVMPLLVALGAFFVLKEKLGLRSWFGFALAITGVVWLSLGSEKNEHASNPFFGNMLELCAMFCGSVYALCSRRLSRNYHPLFITAMQSWVGMLFFLPAVLAPDASIPTGAPLSSWLAIIYLAIGITFGAYGMYNFGLSRVSAGQASIFINLIPVMTLLMGVLFLKENPALNQYLASALVLAGVFVSQSRNGKKQLPG